MMLQLNPHLPIITPKGKAIAHAIIDTGIENDLQWICFQDNTGECWTWNNTEIRAQSNVTLGRDYISPFYNPEDVAFKKEEEDEEIQGEESDEECEESSEEEDFDWEAAHDIVEKENCELRKNLRDANSQINLVKDIVKDLIKQDHIFPGKIDQVIKKLALCPGETEDALYGLQAGRTIRMKD